MVCCRYLHVQWYRYTIYTGAYMCEWWEVMLIQLGVLGIATVATISLLRLTVYILYIFDYL